MQIFEAHERIGWFIVCRPARLIWILIQIAEKFSASAIREGVQKKTIHPRVFVRFGKTKGEIRVKKGNFRGDLGGV